MRAAEATRREAATRAKRDADEIASLQALLDVHETIGTEFPLAVRRSPMQPRDFLRTPLTLDLNPTL